MGKTKKAGLSIGGVLLVLALLAAQQVFGFDLLAENSSERVPDSVPIVERASPAAAPAERISEDAIRQLIEGEISGEMVTLEAEVVKVLPDDNDGSRHQRLLLALESGGTVLISHNIDLASRVPAEEGDVIVVRGQYEWNEKGGVVHWTHHDPKGWREGGWIEVGGERYE